MVSFTVQSKIKILLNHQKLFPPILIFHTDYFLILQKRERKFRDVKGLIQGHRIRIQPKYYCSWPLGHEKTDLSELGSVGRLPKRWALWEPGRVLDIR